LLALNEVAVLHTSPLTPRAGLLLCSVAAQGKAEEEQDFVELRVEEVVEEKSEEEEDEEEDEEEKDKEEEEEGAGEEVGKAKHV